MPFIDNVIESAYRHGFDSELDMEVGDLQSLARDLWKLLTPAQRKTFAADPTWRDFVEMWPTRPTPKKHACPKCGNDSHRCQTGDPGCRHCDDPKCGHGWRA